MTTTTLKQNTSKQTKSSLATKPIIKKEVLEEWKDIVEEVSDQQTIKDVMQARKEHKEGKTIPYTKLLKKL